MVGFFHSNGTWGCAANKDILLPTFGLAKGILFGNLSLGKGILLEILVKERSNFGNSCREILNFGGFSLEEDNLAGFV